MASLNKPAIAVLGGGSWGTALAKHMADRGHPVRLWVRRPEQAKAIAETHENGQYLPGIRLPADVEPTTNFAQALFQAPLVFSVVPSHTTRAIWTEARVHLAAQATILSASKGIENASLALMSDVLAQILPGHSLAFMSGPSFAMEVAQRAPTAVVVAAHDPALAKWIQALISDDALRAYVSTDVVGTELGGALKNVIAIACGCADGLGFGHNTRAAIMTRGLAEIARIAIKLGADPHTLAGLSGMGDLVLTCTGDLSRNRRVGLALGQGLTLEEILREMGQVAEGVKTAKAAHEIGLREGLDLPIISEMHRILYRDKPPRDSVTDLMRRELRHELD